MAEPIKRVPPPPIRPIPPRPNIERPQPVQSTTVAEPVKVETVPPNQGEVDTVVQQVKVKKKGKRNLTSTGKFGLYVGIAVASFIFAAASIALLFIL